jgi:hypothetical protein
VNGRFDSYAPMGGPREGGVVGWVESALAWLEVDAFRSRFGGRGLAELTRNYWSTLRERIGEEVPWERAIGGAVLGGKTFEERIFKQFKARLCQQPWNRSKACLANCIERRYN